MKRSICLLAIILATLATAVPAGHAELPPDLARAVAWYDTLGYPDAKDLPYVRVPTGAGEQSEGKPFEPYFTEGFLVSEQSDAFTVFICTCFEVHFDDWNARPLTTIHFPQNTAKHGSKPTNYEVLDFKKAAAGALARARAEAKGEGRLRFGSSLTYRARLFGFARACLQKGLQETGEALMQIAAAIPDEQTGEANSKKLSETLQQQIGDAVLAKAEADCVDKAVPWADLLKEYENFDVRFPASKKIALARESVDLLRTMIAEDAEHHPKPRDEMSPDERIAEDIYQLRNFGAPYWVMWIMNSHYPLSASSHDGKDVITPVHQLVDAGLTAAPQLFAALDDRRFTRARGFDGISSRGAPLRLGDAALYILMHLSGQNFLLQVTDNGERLKSTPSERAKAWWAGIRSGGEMKAFVEAVSSGGPHAVSVARKLVTAYPDAAIPAIEAGMRATDSEIRRGELVEVAAVLPGETPLAFLKKKLAPGDGIFSQLKAAQALMNRGQNGVLPVIIEAWQQVKFDPLANTKDPYFKRMDPFFNISALIDFLAASGDPVAIEALEQDIRKASIDVRLGVVFAFLPDRESCGMSWGGNFVSFVADISDKAQIAKSPGGKAGAAIEHLLASALDDKAQRHDLKGKFGGAMHEDPRVCDLAALALALRWPDKYRFQWSNDPGGCDAQIAGMRGKVGAR